MDLGELSILPRLERNYPELLSKEVMHHDKYFPWPPPLPYLTALSNIINFENICVVKHLDIDGKFCLLYVSRSLYSLGSFAERNQNPFSFFNRKVYIEDGVFDCCRNGHDKVMLDFLLSSKDACRGFPHPMYELACTLLLEQNNFGLLFEFSKLLRRPIPFSTQTINGAVLSGKLDTLKKLLEMFDEDFVTDILSQRALLKLAALGGHFEIIQWAFEKKASFSVSMKEALNNVLRHAASQGHFEIVKWAIEKYMPQALSSVSEADDVFFRKDEAMELFLELQALSINSTKFHLFVEYLQPLSAEVTLRKLIMCAAHYSNLKLLKEYLGPYPTRILLDYKGIFASALHSANIEILKEVFNAVEALDDDEKRQEIYDFICLEGKFYHDQRTLEFLASKIDISKFDQATLVNSFQRDFSGTKKQMKYWKYYAKISSIKITDGLRFCFIPELFNNLQNHRCYLAPDHMVFLEEYFGLKMDQDSFHSCCARSLQKSVIKSILDEHPDWASIPLLKECLECDALQRALIIEEKLRHTNGNTFDIATLVTRNSEILARIVCGGDALVLDYLHRNYPRLFKNPQEIYAKAIVHSKTSRNFMAVVPSFIGFQFLLDLGAAITDQIWSDIFEFHADKIAQFFRFAVVNKVTFPSDYRKKLRQHVSIIPRSLTVLLNRYLGPESTETVVPIKWDF